MKIPILRYLHSDSELNSPVVVKSSMSKTCRWFFALFGLFVSFSHCETMARGQKVLEICPKIVAKLPPRMQLRGRPFDSRGALCGNKYSDLENAYNKLYVLYWKENKYSDLNFHRIGGKVPIFQIFFGLLRSQRLNSKIFFPDRLARIKILKKWFILIILWTCWTLLQCINGLYHFMYILHNSNIPIKLLWHMISKHMYPLELPKMAPFCRKITKHFLGVLFWRRTSRTLPSFNHNCFTFYNTIKHAVDSFTYTLYVLIGSLSCLFLGQHFYSLFFFYFSNFCCGRKLIFWSWYTWK